MIRELEPRDAEGCDSIVGGLPAWFGDEVGIAECAAAVRSKKGLVVEEEGVVLGFLTYAHSPDSKDSAEITWMAVRADRRRTGIGTSLIEELRGRLVAAGSHVLTVKTLSDRDEQYPPYEETRQFYLRMGFVRAAELDIWGPYNPAVQFELPLA